jgi:uncharacterized protein (TIGR02246 family)
MAVLIGLGLGFGLGFGPVGRPESSANDDPPAAPAKPAAKASAAAVATDDPNTKVVREAIAAFVKAFNAHDAKALGGLFLDDAELVGAEGTSTRGRNEIAAMFAASFEAVPGLTLESEVGTVRALTPDVLRAEGKARISAGTGDAVQRTNYDALLVRRDGKWRLAELRDTPEPDEDVTPYERLRELEWMVGDWVNEGEEAKVSSSVKWADNQSFLVRTYSIELPGQKPMTGTMFVGWSPQSDQIKSWVFDSAGGHGEGLWTRASDTSWVVKASGTLRDGRTTSATQIHTVLGKDSVKTASIDRIIGGQIAPDMPEIVMVRKPPLPSAPGGDKDTAKPAAAPAPAPARAPGR